MSELKNPNRPVTAKFLGGVLTLAGQQLAEKLNAKFAKLEAEIEQLKARPLQKWAGTHNEGTRYTEASLVTRSGSLWVATTATSATPGEPDSGWRLIVKGRG